MPPTDRLVTCFAAEPPQESAPYGRWADQLRGEFLAACRGSTTRARTSARRATSSSSPTGPTTVAPTSLRPRHTSTGYELYGHVSFVPATADDGPRDFAATADFTAETAAANPEWQLDLCEDVIGTWRGEQGKVAAMTLVWGRPLISGGQVVTAELADLAVDQCLLEDGLFTLVAPDNYRGDVLDIKVFDQGGREIARESLYEDDDADVDAAQEAGDAA